MSVSMTKPWIPLTPDRVAEAPGCVGVFEIVADGQTVLIDYAGGHTPFGLRGALEACLERELGTEFRYERTNAYMSRYRELAQVFANESGQSPQNLRGAEAPGGHVRQSQK